MILSPSPYGHMSSVQPSSSEDKGVQERVRENHAGQTFMLSL